MRVLILLYILQLTLAYKLFKGIIVADDSNFEKIIQARGKYTLVTFYSVGCQHCQTLAPKYEPLATLFNGTDVQIAQIEAHDNKRIRNKEGIRGFPTVRLYHFDGTHVASFTGDRTTERLAQFLTDHTGVHAKWPETYVLKPNGSEEVRSLIEENKKGRTVVAFAAPWVTGWSDRFNIFEKLSLKFPDVQFISVDATAEENSQVVSDYRVSVYPTLVYFDAADSPALRMLEESKTSEDRIAQFLMGTLGTAYSSLDDLHDEKTKFNANKEPHMTYGFNRFADDDQKLDDEKYKKLREL